MPSNPTSFILRFRDLSTGAGDTIRLHRDLILNEGFVWWGWWRKPGEKVPVAAFTALLDEGTSDIPILLFDSGSQQLFNATVETIYWNQFLTLTHSPDPAKTPSYYGNNSYLAWFKLKSIDEAPITDEELKALAYVRVDELFEGSWSNYGYFYDKQVFSPQELRQQDRTIWFTRPLLDTDATNEVKLLDARNVTPSDFPDTAINSRSRTFLWFSDPHFSDDGHHGFPLVTEDARRPMWQTIEEAVKEHGHTDIAGLLASGDFAWKAKGSEFDNAARSLGDLTRTLNLSQYSQLFCPGNHDVAFSDNPNNGDRVVRNLPEATTEYRRFYKNAFSKEPNEFISSGRRFVLGRSTAVDVVSLNSNLLQQTASVFQGHGFVGQPQLDDAARQMGWDDVGGGEHPLRVLMLHHHLLPVTYRELPTTKANYSVVLDAEAIVRWIVKHRIKVVLHGHMHQPFVSKVARHINVNNQAEGLHEFWVLGIGSAGVETHHLGEVGHHTIGTLTFHSDRMRFEVLNIHPTNPSGLEYGLDLPLA